MLEKVADLGLFRGLGLDYDRRAVPDVDFDAPGAPVESLKMQLWGNRAREILRLLSGANNFADSTSLAKVRVKHWLDKSVVDEFSLDDVKWDGKITARGTSFQSHISLVTTVYKDYADKVRLAEERFSLRYVDGNQPSLMGEPLNVTFSRPIPDLKKFVSKLFSGSEPFRLWGSPISIGDQFFRIAVLDLHVAQRLTFEVAPEFMRVYLPAGSCGNTIARLFTNLQHYYDSRVQMRTGDGETLF